MQRHLPEYGWAHDPLVAFNIIIVVVTVEF